MDNLKNEITCQIQVEYPSVDPEILAQWIIDLRNEIASTNLVIDMQSEGANPPSGTKGLDPVIAAIIFSMLSNSLPQILVFLRDWALRREGRVLKIKIQSKKDKFVEMEIPTAMSRGEVKDWIKTIKSALE